MRYILLLRALVNIKRKEKAEEHLSRLFPGMTAKVDGRYWKDPSLWEANLRREVEFPSDQAALWEILSYLRSAAATWTITSGLNDASCDDLVSGIFDRRDGTGLVWCSYSLLRPGALPAPESASDV